MTNYHLIVTGVSHHKSSLNCRSRYTWTKTQQHHIQEQLLKNNHIIQFTLLVTCNRTEIICITNSNTIKMNLWLKSFIPESSTYQHIDQQATRHILRTLCGLDSMLTGETEILGQYKTAVKNIFYQKKSHQMLPRAINNLIASAKKIRNQSGIQRQSTALARIVIDKVNNELENDMPNRRFLLIGAGKIIQQHIKQLNQDNRNSITLVCRNLEKNQILENTHNLRLAHIDNLAELITHHDCIISATNHAHAVVTSKILGDLDIRHKLFIDLAVPRDIQPHPSQPDMKLIHLDDLTKTRISMNILQTAEKMALSKSTYYFEEFLLDQQPTIKAFRSRWFSEAQSVIAQQESNNQTVLNIQLHTELRKRMTEICSNLKIKISPSKSARNIPKKTLHQYLKQLAHEPTIKLKEMIRSNVTQQIKRTSEQMPG